MKNFEMITATINATPARSAWAKGVKVYAEELLESLNEAICGGWFDDDDITAPRLLEKALLNGASDWGEYSWGGCSLIYNYDIAERLCCPSEFKRTKEGDRRPNAREEWLDTQARALRQASSLIRYAARQIETEG